MLYFDQVQMLKYSHAPVSFDAGLRYRIEKKFSIQGYLLDKQNPEGAGSLLSKQENVISTAHDYDDIYLNGIYFGKGRITSIDFDSNTLVRKNDYTYEIVCYEDGNLLNATGGVYAGIDWTNARLIESLTESFEFERNEQGDLSYNHNVAVQYGGDFDAAQGINLAKAAASDLFNATSGLGAFLNDYSALAGVKRLYTESYNVVEASCSFSESISIPKERNGNYSFTLAYQLQQDESGFTNVEETLTVRGLTSPKYAGARQGYNTMRGGAYSRSESVYSAYNFSNAQLGVAAIQNSVSINKFAGVIEAKSTFSNNPKYQNRAVWTRTLELSKDSDGFYFVSERGEIIGYGRPLKDKYDNALAFFNSEVKPSVHERLQDLYNTSGRTGTTLRLIRQSFDKNEFEGKISYEYSKTDNALYADDNFKKIETEVTTTPPVHLTQKYNVFNFKEIVQTQKQSTLGGKSISVKLRGKRGTAIAIYLAKAKTIVQGHAPTGDVFLKDCKYSFTPNSNDFSLDAEYSYAGIYKDINDLKIN